MRNIFAKELKDIALKDERVVLLCGDIGNKLFDEFKEMSPERFYNCGVAEANMTGVAAGLALMGFRPVTYTITPFVTVRCIEQIRIDICYHNVPVIIVGTGSGLSYAELGPTHHSCDDVGLLRMFPNITILCPCDPVEVKLALRAALMHSGPVYIRLGKKGEPVIHKNDPEFRIGKSITVREGGDMCILSTGTTMLLSLSVSDAMHEKGMSARVESFHTVKPLDENLLESVAETYNIIATIEEHSIIGGLGSAVAEWMMDHGKKNRLLRFGTEDRFLDTVGDREYARAFFGLTVDRIGGKILNVIKEANNL